MSLNYLSGLSDFGFEFTKMFVCIRKTTPRYHRCGGCRLRVSVIRGVTNSPHHWYAESATPRITNTESRLLNFLKENSLYRWYGESLGPRTSDTVNRWLPVSLSRRIANSAYHRYREWVDDSLYRCRGVDDSADRWYGESLFKEKINLVTIFRTFNG